MHLDYRLAPEHPFPAALDDAVSLYVHLLDSGIAPDQIIIGGDSAGGGLALALSVRLSELGMASPRGLLLLSPWLDLTMESHTDELQKGDPMLDGASLLQSALFYSGGDLTSPLVSPLYADVAGLAPTLVFVSTTEILIGDSRRFADKARAAAVEVRLIEREGLIHVWPFVDGLPETIDALAEMAEWADQRFAS